MNVKKNRWESQKCQKRVQDNLDNEKYVCEFQNPYGRVKTHFHMLTRIWGFLWGIFPFQRGMFFMR